MSEFDPYYKWLGIPPAQRPITHYALLGLVEFETDETVIESAADRQMNHIQSFKTGKHSDLSQKLLNELAQSKLCLLNPKAKEKYDAELKAQRDPEPEEQDILEPSQEPEESFSNEIIEEPSESYVQQPQAQSFTSQLDPTTASFSASAESTLPPREEESKSIDPEQNQTSEFSNTNEVEYKADPIQIAKEFIQTNLFFSGFIAAAFVIAFVAFLIPNPSNTPNTITQNPTEQPVEENSTVNQIDTNTSNASSEVIPLTTTVVDNQSETNSTENLQSETISNQTLPTKEPKITSVSTTTEKDQDTPKVLSKSPWAPPPTLSKPIDSPHEKIPHVNPLEPVDYELERKFMIQQALKYANKGKYVYIKKDPPSNEQIKEAIDKLTNEFAESYENLKLNSKKNELAAEFFVAYELGLSPATKELAYHQEIIRLATETINTELAFKTINLTKSKYNIDDLEEKKNFIRETRKNIRFNSERRKVIDSSLLLLEELASAGEVESIEEFSKLITETAEAIKDKTLIKFTAEKIKENVSKGNTTRVQFKSNDHASLLLTDPTHPEASFRLGKLLSISTSNWKTGLGLLSQCSKPEVASLAKNDFTPPKSPQEAFERYIAWRDLANKEDQRAYYSRALYWGEYASKSGLARSFTRADMSFLQLANKRMGESLWKKFLFQPLLTAPTEHASFSSANTELNKSFVIDGTDTHIVSYSAKTINGIDLDSSLLIRSPNDPKYRSVKRGEQGQTVFTSLLGFRFETTKYIDDQTINSMVANPRNSDLYFGTKHGNVYRFNASTRQPVQIKLDTKSSIHSSHIDRNGKTLVLGFEATTESSPPIIAYDLSTYQEIFTSEISETYGKTIYVSTIGSDSRYLSSNGSQIHFWAAQKKEPLSTMNLPFECQSFALLGSSYNRYLLTSSRYNLDLLYVDLVSRSVVRKVRCRSPITAIAICPSNKLLATGHLNGEIMIRDFTTGMIHQIYRDHDAEVTKLAFMTTEKLFSIGLDGRTRYWKVNSYFPIVPPSLTAISEVRLNDELIRTDYIYSDGVICPSNGFAKGYISNNNGRNQLIYKVGPQKSGVLLVGDFFQKGDKYEKKTTEGIMSFEITEGSIPLFNPNQE